MAKRANKTTAHNSTTIFVTDAPDAKEVFLAGTFNGWDPTKTPMRSQSDGSWNVELELAPNSYEYKFIVDGAWCCDPGIEDHQPCEGCVPNSFGTLNRTIEIPEKIEQSRQTASAS